MARKSHDVSIVPLDDTYDRTSFDSGQPSLDRYLKQLAGQYERRNLGRTYLAIHENDPKIHGFYTLAAGRVEWENVPPAIAKKLPKHPIPVVRLARLAVDKAAQGKGVGGTLLGDAIERTMKLSNEVGVFALAVDAIDEHAKRFYLHAGFIEIVDCENQLVLPIASIEKALRR